MAARRPLLLLTRPHPASEAFRDALPQAARDSVDIFINPLLTIRETGPLPSLEGVTGLIFTSANGLHAYRTLGGTRTDLPVIAVGEGTAATARAFGFEAEVAGGNADRLVRHVLDRGYRGPLMHLHGEVAIGDIADRLTKAGVPTGEAVLYEQRLEGMSVACREALSQDRPVIAPVFSPRTAGHLAAESEGLTHLWFAAISPAVADALPLAAAPRIRVADAPNRDGIMALVTEMIAEAVALERQSHDL